MSTKDRIIELSLLLEGFIFGKDTSLEIAGEIEVELDSLFPNDDEIQDYVTDFALYRPEGGDFLYNREEMMHKCKNLLSILRCKYLEE